jgi:hypothetical protein
MRRFFPISGAPYTLFDCSVLLITLSFSWYILTPVSATTGSTLRHTLFDFTTPVVWGCLLAAAGLVGVVCSYGNHRALAFGYVVTVGACSFWSVSLLIGATQGGGDFAVKAIGLVAVYGWMARQLISEVFRMRRLERSGG